MATAPEALSRTVLERKLRSARLLNVILAAVAALGLVFGGVQWAQNSGEGSAAAANQQSTGDSAQQSGPSLERRIEGDPMAIGDLDAPVVLTEWVDLRCPYCGVFSRDTFPDLVKDYVDSGKVRIEVQDVAFFGEESLRASTAARAAAEQGHYFEFIGVVFDAAPESGHAELTTDELIAHAKTAGVPDMELFKTDMTRADLRAAVETDTSRASQLGVSGVPFFVVDGQGISGAQPMDTFRQLLDPAVKAAQ